MICLLIMSLEAVESECTFETFNAQFKKKASNKGKKGNKQPGTDATIRVPKKVHSEKHCNLCKKHGGTHALHNTHDCHRFEKDGKEKSNFHATKKGGKKPIPTKQFLSKILDKLEKAIKKKSARSKKSRRVDSNSDSK